MPILHEAVIYLKKAAQLFKEDNPKERALKSQAHYILGDIYHYGLTSLAQAEDEYKLSISINPPNESAKKELGLIAQERLEQKH